MCVSKWYAQRHVSKQDFHVVLRLAQLHSHINGILSNRRVLQIHVNKREEHE